MKTAAVTELWEFYRDNCGGFKEPLRKRLRELDDLLADLESENAKLRAKYAESCQTRAMLRADMARRSLAAVKLGDENAKLKELVRDMFSYAFNREMELCNACVEANGEYADCAACDEYDGACGIAKRRFEELYADRMRELGIEVVV